MESAEIWEAWTKHRKAPHMPLGEAQRREATCPWPHSMPIAYIGPEPSSQLCSGALSMQMACVLSRSPNQPCPREAFQCHPSLHRGRRAPRPHTQRHLRLQKEGPWCCPAGESVGLTDSDWGKGHLRPLPGTVLIPEQLPALHGCEADPEGWWLF